MFNLNRMPANAGHVVTWCAAEVDRQQASALHVSGMFAAWKFAQAFQCSPLTVGITDTLNELVTLGEHGRFRRVPATFANLSIALHQDFIPRQMDLLIGRVNDKTITPHQATKWFLDIHPYSDGNGRTAAILFNMLANTLDWPNPLPDFFENKFLQEADRG